MKILLICNITSINNKILITILFKIKDLTSNLLKIKKKMDQINKL